MFKRNKKPQPEENSGRRATQSRGPQVFSYYARSGSSTGQNVGRGNERETEAPKKKRFHPRVGSIPTLLALLVVVGVILYSLWIQPRPNVVVVSRPGTVYQDTAEYKKAINAAWGSKLGNQFKMSVDAERVQRDIAAALPDVASVQVQLPLLGRRPTVVLTPGTPALELQTDKGGFYVSENGVVMAKNTSVKQNQLKDVPSVQDESGINPEPGKTLLTIEQAAYIHALSRQLSAEGLSVQSMILPANAANEVDVRLNGSNYFIKFATTGEARQNVGAYLAAKKKFDTEGVKPAEYIDVRVDEKVYYK